MDFKKFALATYIFFTCSLFSTAQTTSPGSTIYTSDPGGKVGIGTTSPGAKLDVQGGSISIGTGANIAYRAGPYFSAGNTYFGNTPYISFNALLTTSDIPSGTNAFTPAYNPGGGLILFGEAGGSGLHLFQKNYANGAPPYSLNSFSESFTLSSNGNVGIGTSIPSTKLEVSGRALVNGDYLHVNAENAGRLRVGAAWAMPGLYSGDDGAKDLSLGVPSGRKVYLGVSTGDAYVEGGTGNGYFKGNIGIGTTNPGSMKLAVEGTIGARKVMVTQATTWPDYVFHPHYELRSISSLEAYINENKHLPDVPSEKEVEKEGLDVGSTQAVLLKKIEELTLYVIEQDKKNQEQQTEIESLKQQMGYYKKK